MIDMEKYEAVHKRTKDYVAKQLVDYLEYNYTLLSEDNREHVISIGTSILEAKFPDIGPGYTPGSFIQAILDNDLNQTFASGDAVNLQFVKFYCQLIYNFSPYQVQ